MSDIEYDCDVIIVGAGLSGLACANLLQEAGLSTAILEAADRIGGRIHSVYDEAGEHYIADLGPTWVWPEYQPVITHWLRHLNINSFPQHEIGKAVLDYGQDQPVSLQTLPTQDGIMRIEGGPQALVEALFQKLPPGTVKFSQSVRSIDTNDYGLTIKTNQPDNQTYFAKVAIICVPVRLVHQSIKLPQNLGVNILQLLKHTPTWMATQAKAVILFDDPFWRDQGLSGRVASHAGPLVEIHDHSHPKDGSGALFGFISWPHQRRKSNVTQLKKEITAQLIRCFGEKAGKINAIHIEDWAEDNNICSIEDINTITSHPDIMPAKIRGAHADGKLFFGVSETAAQSPGLIEGAFVSAMNASNRVISALKS